MDALHLRYYLDILITSLLRGSPWLIATVASTALICFSPFGRAIAAALRERRQSADLLEDSNDQLRDIQRSLSEVVERLDATDRQLRQLALPQAAHSEPRVPTPV